MQRMNTVWSWCSPACVISGTERDWANISTMSHDTKYSALDRFIIATDEALRTVSNTLPAERPSPAQTVKDSDALSDAERAHAGGLMRVNHAGEVCAQALYRGQALTVRNAKIREQLEQAALEEADHLAWCAERLRELDTRSSRLNPLWYGCSWLLGACAGALGDKVNLGFLAATEQQVSRHLEEHIQKLPPQDHKSKAILNKMLEEESAHAHKALASGGMGFHKTITTLMYRVSRLLVYSSYRI